MRDRRICRPHFRLTNRLNWIAGSTGPPLCYRFLLEFPAVNSALSFHLTPRFESLPL